MNHTLQIQIATPCHENWNDMDATQQGRFCLSCKKEVVDFSSMTDATILQHLSVAGKNSCGRFGHDQLNRNLVAPPEPRKIWWRYWMSIAASVVLLSSKSTAQQKIPADTIVVTPSVPALEVIVLGGWGVKDKNYYKNNYHVTGVVTDGEGRPVPGASIIIKDTKTGVSANENGEFSLFISGEKTSVLRVSAVGYNMQEIKIDNHQAQSSVTANVELRQMDMGLMGDVVIVGKRKKRLLNFFKRDSVPSPAVCAKENLVVYPNPVSKGSDIKVSIDHFTAGNYVLAAYDIMGNLVAAKEIIVGTGNLQESLHCDTRFNSGTYVINVTGNGKTASSRCIVQ